MIDALDNTLRHLFLSNIPVLTQEAQVLFQPPDEAWRSDVVNLNKMALNVYLVELRENRRMRDNGRRYSVSEGIVTSRGRPRQLDCHYLITAWSPAKPGPMVEPTVDEHKLLYDTTAVLMQADPIQPRKIYAPGPPPASYPKIFVDEELPTSIVPPEGFPKYAEFWGTMHGHQHDWKPAVYLVVTLPVVLETRIEGPMVTTRITEYRQSNTQAPVEMWAEIGGTVLDATSSPVPGTWVGIYEPGGIVEVASTTTDNNGRFIFNLMRPGNYQLQFVSINFPAQPPRNITVPSPTGEYNLQFL